jgi:hypothetical protein
MSQNKCLFFRTHSVGDTVLLATESGLKQCVWKCVREYVFVVLEAINSPELNRIEYKRIENTIL